MEQKQISSLTHSHPHYCVYLTYSQLSIINTDHMFHLPDQETIRLTFNYTEAFTLTALWNVGIADIIITCAFLLLFLIKKYQLRLVKNQTIRESMLTQEDHSSNRIAARTSVSQDELYEKSMKVAPKSIGFKVVNLLTSLFFYLFWIGATIIYLVFFMFGTFGRGTHIDVLSVFILTLGVVLPTLIWKQQTKTSSWEQQKGETVFTIVMLVLWLAVSVFLVVATKGACVSYYNDNYGFSLGGSIRVSTEFTRILELEQLCKDGIVCHLYPTLPEDASSAVFFNAHAGSDLGILLFKLRRNGAEVGTKNSSTPLKMDNVQSIGQRTVHSVLFTGLTADTTYDLEVTDNNGVVKKTAKYKTVPNASSLKLKMAIGGDLGMTKQGVQMTSYLQAFQPDVIILGGDTTYDDGMRSCYTNWDELYTMFENIYEKIGRLVPLVMSVGNHDVGFDALTDNAISTDDEDIPLLFYFNPQHSSSDAKIDIPKLDSRSSYHYHKIGPSLMFNLDSGYVKDFSDQTTFIRNQSTNNPQLYHFANYHNPIYPSCTNHNQGSNDRKVIDKGLTNWAPLFDEFAFIASMQHHTHYRKFTYKIKNNTVSTSGTRYIGDGSWGVSEDICPEEMYTQRPQLLESYANEQSNHLWQVTLDQIKTQPATYQINYTAINLKGQTVIQKIEELPALQ